MNKKELVEKYEKISKHSNYQILPHDLHAFINIKNIKTDSRFEAERLRYILSNIVVENKIVADIGGNTGFFTFELINCAVKKIIYIEGNTEHFEFTSIVSRILNKEDKITALNEYFNANDSQLKFDIILLFNVLHHIGDDYGHKNTNIKKAKKEIVNQLQNLSNSTNILVLQLGFNLHGDTSKPLFKNGTKQEMIDFIKDAIKDRWDILNIGIAKKTKTYVMYKKLNAKNILRDDSLGEFLNRPIFILKSKNYGKKS